MDAKFTPIAHVPIAQYLKTSFTAKIGPKQSFTHDVYSRGEGPPVIVIQELPGIGIETLQLADRLVAAGFQVVLPHLFGPLGKTQMLGNLVRVFCMRREFHLFRANRTYNAFRQRTQCLDTRFCGSSWSSNSQGA